MKKIIVFALVLIVSFPVLSQLKLDGQIRPRFEFRDGYKNLTTDTCLCSMHVSQRSRIGLSYSTDRYSTRMSFQDVRVWGEEKFKTNTTFAAAHELWFRIKLNSYWAVKIGRQELKYDNQRLVGLGNFNQVGGAHDAFKLEYKKEGFSLNYVTAFNQNKALFDGSNYDMIGYYKTLNILWLSLENENIILSSLSIADGSQDVNNPNSVYQRFTSGLMFNMKQNKLAFDARGFYQMGRNSTNEEVSAFYLNGDVHFQALKKFKVTGGIEYKSGNDPNKDSRNDFSLLVGSLHKFNGKIDYFSTASTTNISGLVNQYIKLDYSVNDKLKLLMDFHMFSSQQNYIDVVGEYDKYLASEFDLEVKYKFAKDITISALYSIILADETTSAMNGGDYSIPGNFFFLMIDFKPAFLN